uniref:Uncharacterized protein n=1 Tax=Avena sativa TaxID=4498 RepID=A0ACD5VLW0_AVESA
MADAGDEIPPAATGHDAEQSEAKRKAPITRREDQLLKKLALVRKSSKEAMEEARAAVDGALSMVTELEATYDADELTLARLEEDCEKHLQSAIIESRIADKDLAEDHASREELQDVRKALIDAFLKYKLTSKDSSVIGIKMMGDLDEAPFKYDCMRKYGNDGDWKAKASMLLSVWQDELKNPFWRPLKTVEGDEKTEVVVDEDDSKLVELKNEYGPSVYSAVKVAVAELWDYDMAEGYPVPELWNFGERRKATVVEALKCVLDHLNK